MVVKYYEVKGGKLIKHKVSKPKRIAFKKFRIISWIYRIFNVFNNTFHILK